MIVALEVIYWERTLADDQQWTIYQGYGGCRSSQCLSLRREALDSFYDIRRRSLILGMDLRKAAERPLLLIDAAAQPTAV